MIPPASGQFFSNYSFSSTYDNIIVSTSSVQEVPSNKDPLLNLTVNGILKPSDKPYELLLTFPVNQPGPSKDQLAGSYGTFTIGNYVYNALKIIKSAYDTTNRVLTLILDIKRTCFKNITKPRRFSFSIQLDDCPNYCIEGCLFYNGCVCTAGAVMCTKK